MSLTGSLLGEQSVVAPGGATVRSSRSVTLLAFLMVHSGVAQPRGRVAAALWPESTDAQALTNLRRELHALRRLLGDESGLVVTPTDLTWSARPGHAVDVCELRGGPTSRPSTPSTVATAPGRWCRRSGAIGWYRGELLPGARDEWPLEIHDELEPASASRLWLGPRRTAGAGRQRAGRASRSRRGKRVELRPFEESGYRSLMELQEASGDPAAAVGTFHRCASVLERDLGVQPDRATRELLRRIISRTGTGHPDPAGGTPPRGSADAPGGLPRGPELVGRRAGRGADRRVERGRGRRRASLPGPRTRGRR